ncbi:hypothetical protein QYF68_26440 [Mycolicibacterium austroafricanum]|uniref:Holin n=1 Tax=Mycolicibacterium austroafricanum TaxID=39687 RepID=A0ABT8HKP3_MYCAO|nr:hypothetical protein [Mycolicibacterium austroafricanum]MDN4521333.1 hypothetical protein [Mycolicibacterium austroafricanum]
MRWLYSLAVLAVLTTVAADIWVDSIDYELAARISLIYVSVFIVVFTLLYLFRSNWRSNRIGKIFLVKSIAFSIMLSEITVANWVDLDYPGRFHVRYVIQTLAAIAYLAMDVALWREQNRDRDALDGLIDDDQ